MYLASATRPDIAYAVSKLSPFVSNSGSEHWRALERVMRYLVGTMKYGIQYSGDPKVLEGYSDANWISDADELKATSGYVFTLGGGTISWKSCKETILTKSTMEAELASLDTAIVEVEWLRELLMDLPIVEKPIPTILMNCDNQTVIVKVNSSKDNMKSSSHVLTVYFGTPNMFITFWFGFDYGTNPPLGTLIIHLCACIWKCCVYVRKHGHNGRIRNKFKGAFTESCSCS
jgi:hypothetical protein